MGGDVLATENLYILDSVLKRNIASNTSSLNIQARELDWTVPSEAWNWTDPVSITNSVHTSKSNQVESLFKPPFDIIFTSDTIYSHDLVQPLLDTILALALLSAAADNHYPPCYVCLERRDPQLVDHFFARARQMDFAVSRIPHTKVKRALGKTGVDWNKEEWEAIELWKLQLAKSRLTTNYN